jgi:hypothetical protein
MSNELVPVGPLTTYGGTKPDISQGVEEFMAHDATKTWSDGGAIESLLQSLIPEFQAMNAEQVKQALVEFLINALLHASNVENKIQMLVDMSGQAAPLSVGWPWLASSISFLQAAIARGDDAFVEVMRKEWIALGENFPDNSAKGAQQTARTLRSGRYGDPGRANSASSRPRPGRIAAPSGAGRRPAGA